MGAAYFVCSLLFLFGRIQFASMFLAENQIVKASESSGKREEVPLERIVLSNMDSIEAIIDVLAEKGLVTREEVLKRMEKVIEERWNR